MQKKNEKMMNFKFCLGSRSRSGSARSRSGSARSGSGSAQSRSGSACSRSGSARSHSGSARSRSGSARSRSGKQSISIVFENFDFVLLFTHEIVNVSFKNGQSIKIFANYSRFDF